MCRLAVTLVLAAAILPGPDFTLKNVQGRDVSLRQHRGRVVLVNFWATWCPPCRTEIPWLMELQERFGTELVVLGVAMDEDGARTVTPWVQRERFSVGRVLRPINYQILIGSEGVADTYRVESLPATFLIGRDGSDVRRIDGPFDRADLERSIRKLLPGK